jgi:small subunit ribosomal protein S6
MTNYEVVFIIRPDVATSQVEALTKKFNDVATEKGGKVIKTESWGLRSLAYRVKKHRKGYYVMLGIQANGDIVNEVERQLRINDDVIRFLTMRVEELDEKPSIMMAPRRRNTEEASA